MLHKVHGMESIGNEIVIPTEWDKQEIKQEYVFFSLVYGPEQMVHFHSYF